MAATKYTYSIADDTQNGKVNPSRLKNEYSASAIIHALDYVATAADVLDIWTKDTLSSGDETILDGLVAAHTGEPLRAAEPVLDDGRTLVTSSAFPKGMIPVFPGLGDDVANGVRGSDTTNRWHVSSAQAETITKSWQFITCSWIGGGTIQYKGALPGDFVDFKIYAPPTPVAYNGATGNCSLYAATAFSAWDGGTAYTAGQVCSSGGTNYVCVQDHTNQSPPNGSYWSPYCNVIVPAAGNGVWDVDLVEKLNANVHFTKAVPVPVADAEIRNGWYVYDCEAETMVASATQQGNCNLYDFRIDLVPYLEGFNILGDGSYKIQPDVSAKRLAPQHRYEAKITHGGTNQLYVAWNLYMGR